MSRVTLSQEEKEILLENIEKYLVQSFSPSQKHLVKTAKDILNSKRKRLTAVQWFNLYQKIERKKQKEEKNSETEQKYVTFGWLSYADKNSEFSSETLASLIYKHGLKPYEQKTNQYSVYMPDTDLPEELQKYQITTDYENWKNALPKHETENLIGKYYAKSVRIKPDQPHYNDLVYYLERNMTFVNNSALKDRASENKRRFGFESSLFFKI